MRGRLPGLTLEPEVSASGFSRIFGRRCKRGCMSCSNKVRQWSMSHFLPGRMFLLLSGLAGLTLGAAHLSAQPVAPSAGADSVEARIARMTLEQKVGQLVVIGFDGTAYDAGFREMIEKYQVGGVIFFAR